MKPVDALARYAEKSERLIVGLMSGTSVDAIDAALVRVEGSGRSTRVELLDFQSHPWPSEIRERILAVSQANGSPEEVSRLAFEIGTFFADAAEAVRGRNAIDAVASHGQTVSHTAPFATLQLGNPAVICTRLGVPVVSDFRSADVALGGQGAPLVPYVDWCLLTDDRKSRAIQNIGGIGNVTFLPPNAARVDVIGFDTGPGNMLIDLAARWATNGAKNFDEGGALASAGKLDVDLLEWLYSHPFLQRVPPKSAGREEFGVRYFHEIQLRPDLRPNVPKLRPVVPAPIRQATRRFDANDLVATLTDFTALSIADAYARYLPTMPEEVILCGGGAKNRYLVERLRVRLPECDVVVAESIGVDSRAKEAVAFTVLANETLLGNPSNLPRVTGASRNAILGNLTFP